jgi:hypothetical protein
MAILFANIEQEIFAIAQMGIANKLLFLYNI